MSAVLSTEDLLGEIISWLPKKSDLGHSALISRKWCRPSQARIFHSLILTGIYHSDKLSLLQKMLDILEESPHLTAFIQRFDLVLSPLVLRRIAAVNMPALMACTVNSWIEIPSEIELAIPLINEILRRPTLQVVRLHGHFFGPHVLNRILDGCSVNIHRLDASSASFTQSGDPTSTLEIGLLPARHLEHFAFGHDMLDWISHAQFAFDISGLRGLKIADTVVSIPFKVDFVVALDLTCECTYYIVSGRVFTQSQTTPKFLQISTALQRCNNYLSFFFCPFLMIYSTG